ncbi:tubulin polyglutamylase TTLL5-like [Dendronephthya gigantea]|uniref:tubulin polyglutamylase TTLL5-like n=1 Tax=Dendronephthya gigantea TaxID=151771 RepID=UPI00106CDA18|nr:tubulin polyglutamylase TTLL5-like [Dendronephthya gigantea]
MASLDECENLDSIVSSWERPQVGQHGERQHENKQDDERLEKVKSSSSIIRHGETKRKKSLVNFTVQNIFWGLPLEERTIGAKFHLSYKFVKTECKIVRNILHQHCFQEVHQNSSDFNLMWTGSHLKPHTLHGLREFQKVNHFPRSYELTRKDRLYQNIQKMQSSKGFRHFDFIPEAYVSPGEYNQFCASFAKQRGLWIVKPVASSRGRGIFLINHPSQIPLDDTLLVSKYISNPLLVDGFKFDLRLYIGVTSFDPLRIYLYEEGLTRFATVKYDKSNRNIKNSCMHLTNYSVNKKNDDYVSCSDPEVEDYGNKWSFGALLRFLKAKGIDTSNLVSKIEDLIIKTMISGEIAIATACKMFVPHHGNCFEIYGFDVLIDDNLKPWLMEVNLSPSMACDSPMDLKIKSNLLTDMFNLTGILAHDPLLKRVPNRQNVGTHGRNQFQRQRCQSAGLISTRALSSSSSNLSNSKNKQIIQNSERGLTTEELRVIRETKEEYKRRGHFVRIFPSPTSRECYGSYLEYRTTNNRMLFARLFLDKSTPTITYDENNVPIVASLYTHGQTLNERMICYERQLPSLETTRQQPQVLKRSESVVNADDKFSHHKESLAQGELEDRHTEVVFTNEKGSFPIAQDADVTNHRIVHMDEVINLAGNLNKLQARKAFAMYLRRVKERLLVEVSSACEDSDDDEDKDKQDDQMNLVIRFLKRAAKNLRQEFKVIIPSHKLPQHDRRRMLAQQLGDFVHIYDKETAQMKNTPEISDTDTISDEDFKTFLNLASENDLEELLTRYTRLSNNASIFLGSSPSQPASSQWKATKPPLQRQTETRKHLRSHSAHALSTQDDGNKRKAEQSRTQSAISDQNRRLAGAIAAYGKSLDVNKTRKRPASANVSTERKRMSSASFNRPISAKNTGAVAHERIAREKSVSEALKQLAKRRAIRQYSARPPVKIETNKWMHPVENTDNSADSSDNLMINRVPSSTDRVPMRTSKVAARPIRTSVDNSEDGWMVNEGYIGINLDDDKVTGWTSDVHKGTQGDRRTANADRGFFTSAHNELQVSSKPTHSREIVETKRSEEKLQETYSDNRGHPMDKQGSSVKKNIPSRVIRIPCGDEDTDVAKTGDTMDKLGSAREDYNKHMQMLIERLAAHKFSKPNMEAVIPKPPARPRSAKRPVSAQRMSRITTSHGSLI